jgi:hypothetical protein
MTNPYDCVKFISSDGNTLTIDASCPVCGTGLVFLEPNVGIHELGIEFDDELLIINGYGLDLRCPNHHQLEE